MANSILVRVSKNITHKSDLIILFPMAAIEKQDQKTFFLNHKHSNK